MLADDHDIIRGGLKARLMEFEELKVIGEVENGNQLLELLQDVTPDLAVVDLGMPELGGMTLIERVRNEHPDVRVVILSSYDEYYKQARKLQVAGYILKKELGAKIAHAVHTIARGGTYYSPGLAVVSEPGEERAPGDVLPEVLTDREREVLALVVQGKKNTEIAEAYDLSLRTVEFHKTNLKKKLKLSSTAELVQYSIKHGLS